MQPPSTSALDGAPGRLRDLGVLGPSGTSNLAEHDHKDQSLPWLAVQRTKAAKKDAPEAPPPEVLPSDEELEQATEEILAQQPSLRDYNLQELLEALGAAGGPGFRVQGLGFRGQGAGVGQYLLLECAEVLLLWVSWDWAWAWAWAEACPGALVSIRG